MAFYGFTALFVVTVWAVFDLYVFPLVGIESMYPFGLLHPMKLLANVGAVLLIYGSVKAIADRMRYLGDPDHSSVDLRKLISAKRLAERRKSIALDRTHAMDRQDKKETTITKTAIAKSLIESGHHKPDAETLAEAESWYTWITK